MPNTTANNTRLVKFYGHDGPNSGRNSGGFTLIELLLVVALITILSGIMLTSLNFRKQREYSFDAIKRANISKLVSAVESYRTVIKRYPTDPNGDGNPTDDPSIADFIKGGWIRDEPLNGTVYLYYVNSSGTTIGITTTLSDNKVAKYRSEWNQIRDCRAGSTPNNTGC